MQDQDRMWIFGRRCERILMDWEVYVIIAVLGLVFVSSIILFICLLCRSCHKGYFSSKKQNLTIYVIGRSKSEGETYVPQLSHAEINGFDASRLDEASSSGNSIMHQSGSFKIKPGYSDSMINAIHDVSETYRENIQNWLNVLECCI